MHYYRAKLEHFDVRTSLPKSAKPLSAAVSQITPPLISELLAALRCWQQLKHSPGPLLPQRLWLDTSADGNKVDLYVGFPPDSDPEALLQVGLAPDLAAWLVLLDCWMETYVVVARARTIWSADELAHALTFITPAFLPRALVALNSDWPRVAQAVALSVADGPLAGEATDKHWQTER